ncbi:hypothetical protein QUB33_28665 [Microcoleus sp. B3-A4]|uniref:hypothetical protein n=1 Tax=Microcoleus sp. B3-A4 TaxID=2818653 RepID=UPI002FD201B8
MAVEVCIVSVLREVIVGGSLETPWVQILSTGAFLIVFGVLLVLRVWFHQPSRELTRNVALLTEREIYQTMNQPQNLWKSIDFRFYIKEYPEPQLL